MNKFAGIFASFALVTTVLPSGNALACLQGHAHVAGSASNATVNARGICEMDLQITRILGQHPACPLHLTVGSTIKVSWQQGGRDNCPRAAGQLRGVVSSGSNTYSISRVQLGQ
jgi:hypothetical protein